MNSRSVRVPAYSGRGVLVRAGEFVSVVDVEGQQVGDMWALDATDETRWLSVSHTRDRIERLFPSVGQSFTDQRGQPILQYVSDTSPGKHDTLFAPCDQWLYEGEGMFGHANCHDNFLSAAGSAGRTFTQVPDPVNLFQNSSPSSDGALEVLPAASAAGDRITFSALRDLYLIVSACSVDYWPTNGDKCTDLELTVTS